MELCGATCFILSVGLSFYASGLLMGIIFAWRTWQVSFLNQESLVDTIQQAVETKLLESNNTRTRWSSDTIPCFFNNSNWRGVDCARISRLDLNASATDSTFDVVVVGLYKHLLSAFSWYQMHLTQSIRRYFSQISLNKWINLCSCFLTDIVYCPVREQDLERHGHTRPITSGRRKPVNSCVVVSSGTLRDDSVVC